MGVHPQGDRWVGVAEPGGDDMHLGTGEDSGGPWTPANSDPARPHGLEIVRALASDWGIEEGHTARTIWARFDWPDHAYEHP